MKHAQNIAQYIRYFVDDASTQLMPYIAQGKLNNEFIRGKQHRRINPRNLNIEDKLVDPNIYTERKTFNRLLPIYLTRYGIITQNMPIAGIKPQSNTSKAVYDSEQTNKFINNFMLDCDFKQMFKKSVRYADVYGIVWFKTGIDWTEGDEICTVDTKIGDTTGKITIKEGRPFVSVVPIQEVFVDSVYAETMDEINELVHRRVFPVDYIRKRWGIEAQKESINETKLQTYPRYSNFGISNAGDIEYAYIYEYYKKPDALYPEGRYVITCNDKIIYDGKLPYKNAASGKRIIPFDFYTMQSLPNYLIGVTVYSQLIPIQETYNSIKNRYLEYVNHIAIGQLYYWEGSLINKNNFTTKPGKLIGLKRNARKPEPVQKDKLSQEFINYLNKIEEDMLVTAGLSQMTAFGSSKSNVRTDGVVDKLSESDENKLVNALDNISDCFIQMFKKLVYLEKEREQILSEKLKVANVDNYILQYKLTDVDAEQITIVNREFLMTNDQIFDKKLQQAGNFGIYAVDSPLSYKAKCEFLNSIKASYLIDTLDPEQRATHDLCDEENSILFRDHSVPEVEEFHNHAAHIEEHNLYRISPEVRKLAKEDPKAYKAFQEAMQTHIDQHKKFLDQTSNKDVYQNAKAALNTTSKRSQGSKIQTVQQ